MGYERRRVLLAATVLFLLPVAAACAERGPVRSRPEVEGDRRPADGDSLVDLQNFAAAGEPDHIDPALANTVEASQPGHLLFDGLTDHDYRTGQVKPAVAESWRSNGDATHWVFTVRRGVTFSNGDPVLPSDFKFAWERVASRSLASEVAYHMVENLRIRGARDVNSGRASEMSGLRADDEQLTLDVELEAPLSFLPEAVGHLAFSPVPRKLVTALPDQSRWEQGVMIGNGPYVMAEPWKHDQYIRLRRNDRYWGGIDGQKPHVERIDFRISKDIDAAFAAFEAGAGDTALLPPGRIAEGRRRYAGHLTDAPISGVYYWGFNNADPLLGGPGNVKLRQAISLAVDKHRIVDVVYSGSRGEATGWTPPSMPGYRPGLATFSGRDLARARRLVSEWEADTGKVASRLPPIRLTFSTGAGHDSVATIIQADLGQLGLASALDPRDPRTYFSQMRRGEGQFLRGGWVADYNAYDNMLFPVFASSQVGVGDNLVQYRSARFDTLIDQARRTVEQRERDRLYQEAESVVLNEDVAVVPLNWYRGNVVWSRRLNNVIQSPLSFLAYDRMWLSRR